MLNDLPHIYMFWMTIFLIGVVNIPITFILFRNFIDKGYIFAKVLGIVLISYLVWILSSLKLVSFTKENILLIGFIVAVFNLLLFVKVRKNNPSLFKLTSQNLKIIIIEEILFTAGLVFWSYVRGYNTEIRGLEKFMDFGFVNSILRTKYMPPLDMWLSASPSYLYHTINYYYFGHFVTALLTKVSMVAPEITYNIMLGTLFGFTFTCSFSIAANLFAHTQKHLHLLNEKLYNKRTIICGLLAGFLVALGGNLHTLYAFTKGYALEKPQPPWEVLGTPSFSTYWYPNATRFISNTIHEFPIYSFVVSDLHGHVLDIPFVFLTIALLLNLLISKFQSSNINSNPNFKAQNNKNLTFSNLVLNWILDFGFWILLLGLLLAVMYMTNAWDGLIYLGLSGLVLLLLNSKFKNKKLSINFVPLIISLVFLLFTFFIVSLPFNRTFIPFAKGIGINCVTPNASNQVLCDHSPWWMLLILWGYFYFFAASFLLLVKKRTASDIFVILMIIISTLLLIAPEFIFARDIYPAHYRANTMFKLGYQAFMMLGISVSYIFFRFVSVSPFKSFIKKIIWWKLAYIQLFLVLLFPLFAINSYYNGLKQYQGLDGLSWLWKTYPGDLAAIEYFKDTLSPFEQPVVLEAVGESYTDYSRISANSGLPTVVGWPVHEWLWRGSYDEPGKRVEEVRKIYEAATVDEAVVLLKKYNVKYVIIGTLEQQKYPKMNEQNFYSIGDIVFQKGSTRIYKLKI